MGEYPWMADVVTQALNEGRVSDETAAYLNEVVDEDNDDAEGGGYILGTDVYVPSSRTTSKQSPQIQDSLRPFPGFLSSVLRKVARRSSRRGRVTIGVAPSHEADSKGSAVPRCRSSQHGRVMIG